MDNLSQYIEKHSKARDKNLKYDFLPSLVEIIERPAHSAGSIIIYTIALLLTTAVLWACFSKLDIVVTGMGQLVPRSNLSEIKAAVSGYVESINTEPGAFVKAGDSLIILENEVGRINDNELSYHMEWNRIQTEIARARLEDEAFVIDIPTYDSRFSDGLRALALEIESHMATKESITRQIDETLEELERALENGNTALVSSLTMSISSYQERLEANDRSYRQELYLQLLSLEQEAEAYKSQYEKYRIGNEMYIITAPVDGYVNYISVTGIGQMVIAGNTVVSVVPADSPLEFECYLPDRYRGDITEGMSANLKLSAYSFSDYGAITGTISKISPSTFSHELYGTVYRVSIEIHRDGLNPDIQLVSGLSGTAEIVSGKQTVLEYFLRPISGTIRESMKEK